MSVAIDATIASDVTEPAKPRVLIVDDSRIVRATIIKHVKGRYEFREEADGEAGWAALLLDPGIQVVISDLGMPKLDGYGLLERIRSSALSRIRGLPFVIISGDEDEESRARAKDLGATDFITKGIGNAELLARLDSLVKLTQTQGQLEESRGGLVEDPVTGLNSSKVVEIQLTQALSHAERHGLAASALVLGLDRLDEIGARYGQPTVDQLLRRFGQMLLGKIRREDSLGHASPTSFAIVSPSTGADGAQVFAGRLREAVEQANVVFQGQRVELSVSVGIASRPPDAAIGPAEFVAIAAERMQEAAAAGGNRIVGCTGTAVLKSQVPKLETALAMLQAGHDAPVRSCVAQLVLGVLPLLQLADAECALGLPLETIESILRERARGEKDASP